MRTGERPRCAAGVGRSVDNTCGRLELRVAGSCSMRTGEGLKFGAGVGRV